MTNTDPVPMIESMESIADSLARIADALEHLCMTAGEAADTPVRDRPAIYEALRHVAINADR